MINVKNRHIAIIGAARSGLAAAGMLKARGADVFVSDASAIHPDVKSALEEKKIGYEEHGHTDRVKDVHLAVISPGVPDSAPVMKHYKKTDIPAFSEIEAASWFNRSPVIAVTGSNGKTTVTSWMEHIWKTAGHPCLLAGNIGRPFSDVVDRTQPGTTVILEVSSFQLDHIRWFRPDVSVICNITPDHLDRYGNSFEAYTASKMRIAENQQADDVFIWRGEDPVLAKSVQEMRTHRVHPRLLSFSDSRMNGPGAGIRDGNIYLNTQNSEENLMRAGDVGLPGRHNLNNGLAAALAARVSEIRNESIRESLETFEGVEHRLELAGIIDGVRYINDSKATNINAVWYALDSYNVPVVLILGGRDKGNDWLALREQIMEKVHTIVAIGEARAAIRNQLEGSVPNLLEAEDMNEAVRLGKKKAKRGEIVLLSPACSSFDMFENYEQRGNTFKEAVWNL